MNKKTQNQETFEDVIPKPSNIYYKLWLAKQEIGKINKSANNPFFKSKYADLNTILDVVEPILHKYNLILLQPIQDGKVYSSIIDCENGDHVNSWIDLPTINDPQKMGSSISYFRRYSVQSLLSLSMQDDDSNEASKAVKEQSESMKILNDKQFISAVGAINSGKYTKQYFLDNFQLTPEQKNVLNELN